MLILNKNLNNYYKFALSKRQQCQISIASKKQTCGIMKTLDVSHTTERQAFTCLLIYTLTEKGRQTQIAARY